MLYNLKARLSYTTYLFNDLRLSQFSTISNESYKITQDQLILRAQAAVEINISQIQPCYYAQLRSYTSTVIVVAPPPIIKGQWQIRLTNVGSDCQRYLKYLSICGKNLKHYSHKIVRSHHAACKKSLEKSAKNARGLNPPSLPLTNLAPGQNHQISSRVSLPIKYEHQFNQDDSSHLSLFLI